MIKKEVTNIRDITECSACASLNIVYNDEREQVICKECGLIFEPMIPLEGGAIEPSILPQKKAKTKKAVKKKSAKKKRR